MHVNHMIKSSAIAFGLALAACGTGASETDAEAIDEQILGEADNSDPALTAALEDQIMVDTDLTSQSNENAALPNEAVRGAPIPDTMTADMARAQEAIDQRRLLNAPAARMATEEDCGNCNGGQSASRGETTLGAMAASQSEGIACNPANVRYSLSYADTMPTAFRPFPNSEITEAAGYDEPGCRFRVVSFRTNREMERMIDWYYTRALRSGYSSEHLIRHDNNVLGGYRERDDGAYYIIFAERPGGGTDIDIVANNGQ